MSTHIEGEEKKQLSNRSLLPVIIILGGLVALLLGLGVSIAVGAADIKMKTVWEAVFNFNPAMTQHQIIQELRMPRALAGAMVGVCFAVSGAIMQGMTRNPMASPGLLGVNSGASFALAIALAFFPGISFQIIILFSFIGAGLGAGLVYGISSMVKGGLTPVRLALAGAAVSALLSSLSQGIAIHYQIAQDLAFWTAGGVAGVKWMQIRLISPWVIVGLIGSILIARSITLLSLGDEIAAGLGQRTRLVKLMGTLIVLVLAGAAVSAVGPVGFVGLVIPHIARFLVGVDYRWVIPCSAVLGGLLMVMADIGARMVNPPFETPVGAITALIGVPFFLYLARKERREL